VKPRVFIGSSQEGLQIAYTIQEELEFDAEITVWKQDVFRPGTIIIDSLQSALVQFDFAVFVMSPDDQVVSRSRERLSPRDNVIFELGLFIGHLGRDRVFFIVSQGPNELKLPTDLLGITSLTFDDGRTDGNLRAALGPACNQLRRIFEAASQPKVALEQTQALHESKIIRKSEPTIALKNEIEKAAAHALKVFQSRAAILFIDIDNFSAVNKWFGSLVCDTVVEKVEKVLAGAVKDQFWKRFGGDQFIACIRTNSASALHDVGENVVQRVGTFSWSDIAPSLYITVSLGIATPGQDESVTEWVVRAIHGSILAKKGGGNRIAYGPLRLGRGVSRAWSDYVS
jgi:diguanylate cyclase (GGDEF)-like protein